MLVKHRGNHAATQPGHVDPALRTRRYPHPLARVQQVVAGVLPRLRTYGTSWRVKGPPLRRDGTVSMRAEVPVFIFTDDLVVTLRAADGGTVVDVRSAARVGKADFGENRRHVLQLLAALDDKLQA